MICHEADDQRDFGMQPAAGKSIAKPHPQAQPHGEHTDGRDEAVELSRHQQQAFPLGDAIDGHHRKVHENSWQVEQPGEPADDENDMKGL